jgi:hypothetical protein
LDGEKKIEDNDAGSDGEKKNEQETKDHKADDSAANN